MRALPGFAVEGFAAGGLRLRVLGLGFTLAGLRS